MLKKFHNKKFTKKIWIFLACVIIPAFVFWGVGSMGGKEKKDFANAGSVFGKKISFLEYRQAVEATRNQAKMQFGESYEALQKLLNIEGQAWDRIVLLHEAARRRIKAGDKEVIARIGSYPFFQSKGRFDQNLYERIVTYPELFNTRPRDFEEQTRQNLILEKLFAQVSSEITASDEEIANEYARANEEVSVSYISSLQADWTAGITPTEEELKDYYTKNTADFKKAPSFNIEYFVLDSDIKAKSVFAAIDKDNPDLLKAAIDAASEVKESGFFEQMASIPGVGWSPEILTRISQLSLGEIDGPVEFDNRFYIIRLKDKKGSYTPEYDAAKETVKETFIKNKSTEIARENINKCSQKLKELSKAGLVSAADWDKTANESGLKTGETAMFKFGSYIEGVGASDNFWLFAKGLKDGEFSEAIQMPTGFYIIKVKSRTPIDEKKYAEEKDKSRQEVLSKKKQEFFSKFLEELKNKAAILYY